MNLKDISEMFSVERGTLRMLLEFTATGILTNYSVSTLEDYLFMD